MTITATQLLAEAKRWVGYDEGRNNDNVFAPSVGHANHQPWCASYVCSMFKRLDALDLIPVPSAYTPSMYQGFVSKSQQIDARRPSLWKPGDIVFFKFPQLNRISHVGIYRASLGAGKVATYEGNTNSAGSRTGGSVLAKSRSISQIVGVGRPRYSTTATKSTKAPARITYLLAQSRLRVLSDHENHVINTWSKTGKLVTPSHIARIIHELNQKRPISAHQNHVFNVWVKEGKVIS